MNDETDSFLSAVDMRRKLTSNRDVMKILRKSLASHADALLHGGTVQICSTCKWWLQHEDNHHKGDCSDLANYASIGEAKVRDWSESCAHHEHVCMDKLEVSAVHDEFIIRRLK